MMQSEESEEEVEATGGKVVSFIPDVKGVVKAEFRLKGVKEHGMGQAMSCLFEPLGRVFTPLRLFSGRWWPGW